MSKKSEASPSLSAVRQQLSKLLADHSQWSQWCTTEELEALLRVNPQWAKKADAIHGRTALMNAAREGDIERVKLLLPLSDPRAVDYQGETALMGAARFRQAQCVKELLVNSDPAQVNQEGWTALMLTVSRLARGESTELLECARALLPVTPLDQQSVSPGENEEGVAGGVSALMLAAGNPHPALIGLFLPFCTEKTIQLCNEDGANALTYAIDQGSPESVRQLVPRSDLGARLLSDGERGRTALMCAAFCYSEEKMQAVLGACSTEICQMQDEAGVDALMLSVGNQDQLNMEELVAKSNLSNRNKSAGHTALMHCFEMDLEDASVGRLVRLLIARSTPEQLAIKTPRGKDAFALSLEAGNAGVVDAFARVATEDQAQEAIDQFGAAALPQLLALVERKGLEREVNGRKNQVGRAVQTERSGDTSIPSLIPQKKGKQPIASVKSVASLSLHSPASEEPRRAKRRL